MICEPKPQANVHASEIHVPPEDPQFPHSAESTNSDHDKQGLLGHGYHMSMPLKEEQSCWASEDLRPEVGDKKISCFYNSEVSTDMLHVIFFVSNDHDIGCWPEGQFVTSDFVQCIFVLL